VDWKSNLAGFREVAGSNDPVVFRYPARSSSFPSFMAGALAMVAGLMCAVPRLGSAGFWFGIVMILTGLLFLSLGTWNMLVVRRIELHPKARVVTDLRRVPLKPAAERVYPYDDILRISITKSVLEEHVTKVVVIELRNRDHVDFGNHVDERAEKVAARLHELTGARITR